MTEFDVRLDAFRWLRDKERTNGGIFLGTELAHGFPCDGRLVTLKGATGIWFPRGFAMPISITTSLRGPYRLDDIADGILTYAYRGTNPDHRDNVGLREACRTRTPLIYFKEVHDHHYQALWPMIVLDDHRGSLFVRASMEPAYAELGPDADPEDIELSPLDVRRYALRQARQRLHQGAFRELVISAYHERCTVCRLAHPELLDAAHIISDTDLLGTPIVQNGLSLCKIHHAAFDNDIMGIDPDHVVHISRRVLAEKDGPMLKHGLQELDGSSIILPARAAERPDRDRLARRFELWKQAG